MAYVFMYDTVTGHVGLYAEPEAWGAYDDPNSGWNRPLRYPTQYLPYVLFHTALDQMEVHAYQPGLVINHASVAGISNDAFGNSGQDKAATFGVSRNDRLLLAHNLGYVPNFLAAVNQIILTPGFPVQALTGGRTRYVTVYATETEIRLNEVSSVNDENMPAVSVSYQLLVFKNPPAPSGGIKLEFVPSSGLVTMGFGRFRSDRAYLQVMPVGVGTPFALPNGPTVDLKNGAPVVIKASGENVKPMPNLRFQTVTNRPFGEIVQYDGVFSPPPTIPVQAP